MTAADDLLTLTESCRVAGRGLTTIRQWIKDGKLIATRESAAKNARVFIRRGDLVATMQASGLLAGTGPRPPSAPTSTDRRTTDERDELLAAIRAERDRLITDAATIRADHREQLAALQRELDQARSRIQALELQADALRRELLATGSHGRGIWGALSGAAEAVAPSTAARLRGLFTRRTDDR